MATDSDEKFYRLILKYSKPGAEPYQIAIRFEKEPDAEFWELMVQNMSYAMWHHLSTSKIEASAFEATHREIDRTERVG